MYASCCSDAGAESGCGQHTLTSWLGVLKSTGALTFVLLLTSNHKFFCRCFGHRQSQTVVLWWRVVPAERG